MNRHTPLSLSVGLALTALFASPSVAAQAPASLETGFVNGQLKASGITMRYVVYVPWDYSPEKQWPVLMFLHGAFHDGTEDYLFATEEFGEHVWQQPELFPCLVVFPHLPSGGDWNGLDETVALQVLEQVVQQYHGDRRRLYLTGLSLGGSGTWQFAYQHPDLFAAIMPVAGCGSAAQMAPKLKSLPIWIFHGDRDDRVSVSCARAMFAAIKAAGNTNVHYTEYAGIGHNAWDLAYSDPKVIQWLLAQKR